MKHRKTAPTKNRNKTTTSNRQAIINPQRRNNEFEYQDLFYQSINTTSTQNPKKSGATKNQYNPKTISAKTNKTNTTQKTNTSSRNPKLNTTHKKTDTKTNNDFEHQDLFHR